MLNLCRKQKTIVKELGKFVDTTCKKLLLEPDQYWSFKKDTGNWYSNISGDIFYFSTWNTKHNICYVYLLMYLFLYFKFSFTGKYLILAKKDNALPALRALVLLVNTKNTQYLLCKLNNLWVSEFWSEQIKAFEGLSWSWEVAFLTLWRTLNVTISLSKNKKSSPLLKSERKHEITGWYPLTLVTLSGTTVIPWTSAATIWAVLNTHLLTI